MKKIILLLSLVLSISVVGQNSGLYPEDLEKLKQERYAENDLKQKNVEERYSEISIESFAISKEGACPEGTILGNQPDGGTGYTSSEDANIINYQSISDLPGGVFGGISIWAIQGFFDGAGWSECGPMDMEFDIIFYEDDSGEPGDVIATETHTISPVVDPDVDFGAWTVSTFTTYLNDPVTITDGWFSIASNNSPTCWSLIINSGSGEGVAGYYDDGIWTLRDDPIAFCILAPLADLDAPAAASEFVVEPGDMGALNADISWVNPNETFGGDVLTELDELVLSRNNEVIFTFDSPEIGEPVSYTDNDINESGFYTYSVTGVNSAGTGDAASASVYVGIDIPAAPENIVLEAVGNSGSLSWDAPTVGLNGGYISEDDIIYSVVRMPGAVDVAESIAETVFVDDEVPGIGNYHYIVTASNEIGEGGSAASNSALLGAEGILLYETFDYDIGTLPPGWTVEGDGAANWTVNNSSSAGGTAPELRLNWDPSFDGFSRLITSSINVEGHSEVRFKFNMYLNNFSTNEGEIAAIDISFDGGDNWNDIWEYVIEGDVPAGVYEYYIDVPDGETTLHLSFRFEGDSFNINQWYFDNLLIEPLVENDLAATAILGNTTPSATYESIYTVTVQNAGNSTQTDYNVKLMKEGNVELVSVAGLPIEFGETISFELPWTPEEGDEGQTYVYGYIDFPDDEIPGNNKTSNLNVFVQPEDVLAVTIGDGEKLTTIPYNFVWHHSISQTLYYPEEIAMAGGVITGVQYTNSFNEDYLDKHIMIWIGETDVDDLSEGWVDPTSLQLVFDGYVDFPAGVNNIFIPLDDIYVYTGGTLVIYSSKADDVWSGGKNFFNTEDSGSNRTRRAQRDNNPFDPINIDVDGAVVHDFANVSIFFSTEGLGSLAGNVTDGDNGLEGVIIDIVGSNNSAVTDENGDFEFPYMLAGEYELEFSKFGYFDYVLSGVIVVEDETTIIEVDMLEIPSYSISGVVKTNDIEDVYLQGVAITLEGYDYYSGATDVNGVFNIESVYEGDYTIYINFPGYETYHDVISVNDDIDLGEIVLIEVIHEPYALAVNVDHLDYSALFSWNDAEVWSESFEGGVLPDGWDQIITNNGSGAIGDFTWQITGEITFDDGGIVPQDGDYQAFIMWDFNNQDEWLITPEFTCPPDDLVFWYYGSNGSVNGDNYYVKVSEDGGNSWTILWNASDLPEASNHYEVPAVVDLSAYSGKDIHLAWQNVDGDGEGLWFAWAIDNISVGDMKIDVRDLIAFSNPIEKTGHNPAAKDGEFSPAVNPQDMIDMTKNNKAFLGFNVYLNDKVNPINPEPTLDNFMLFEGLDIGHHIAGVQSVYSTGESRIIDVTFTVMNNHTVDFDVVGGNGSLAATVNGEAIADGDNVVNGSDITFGATPDEGYVVKQWTINGNVVMLNGQPFTGATHNYTDIAENIHVTVEFEPVSYLVTYTVLGLNGTITAEVDGVTISSGDRVDHAKDIVFTATPDANYQIKEWAVNANVVLVDDVVYTDIVYTYDNLDRNITVTVQFEAGVSVLEQSLKDVVVYPNPFSNELFIANTGNVNRVFITNIVGLKVMELQLTGDVTVKTDDLPAGIYFITFEAHNGERIIRKMVKQ